MPLDTLVEISVCDLRSFVPPDPNGVNGGAKSWLFVTQEDELVLLGAIVAKIVAVFGEGL